jgi:hypothetical protein
MNRKEMIQAYKKTPRPMGIYRVRNTIDGRALVGRSTDLPAILNRERAQLRLNVHRNTALQHDWNTLGADVFVFEIVDTITPPEDQAAYDPHADLRALEALWLDQLQPFDDRGYTRRPVTRP